MSLKLLPGGQFEWGEHARLHVVRDRKRTEAIEAIENCKLQISNCKLKRDEAGSPTICNLQLEICNFQLLLSSSFY
jgi:hypothetical protein